MTTTTTEVRAPGSRLAKWRRRLGTALMVAGIAILAWVFVVWQWNDPFTSLYTRWQQRGLESIYTALVK